MNERVELPGRLVRLVDEAQPGWVACEVVDVAGRCHTFVDKVPMFSLLSLDAASAWPQVGVIGCTVESRWQDEDGRSLASVNTDVPHGLVSTEGVTVLTVFATEIEEHALLNGLSRADLLVIASGAAPAVGAPFGIGPVDGEAWERWRKYAWARSWRLRLSLDERLADAEVETWQTFRALPFLSRVACGGIGDAARRDLLSEPVLRALAATGDLTDYALRQVRTRLALVAPGVDAAVVELILALRTPWALHELLARATTESEVRLIEASSRDGRVSRTERHLLREALRLRSR